MPSPEWIVITLAIAVLAATIGLVLGWALCSATRLIARGARRVGFDDQDQP